MELLGLIAAVVGALVLLAVVYAHFGSSKSVHTSSSRPATTSAPAPPPPAQQWRFSAPTYPVDQAVVLVNNPNAIPVTVILRLGSQSAGQSESTVIPAHGQAELQLGAGAQNRPFSLSASAPILTQRIVTDQSGSHTSYGVSGHG